MPEAQDQEREKQQLPDGDVQRLPSTQRPSTDETLIEGVPLAVEETQVEGTPPAADVTLAKDVQSIAPETLAEADMALPPANALTAVETKAEEKPPPPAQVPQASAAPPTEPEIWNPGDVIQGRYRVEGVLERGGSGLPLAVSFLPPIRPKFSFRGIHR